MRPFGNPVLDFFGGGSACVTEAVEAFLAETTIPHKAVIINIPKKKSWTVKG